MPSRPDVLGSILLGTVTITVQAGTPIVDHAADPFSEGGDLPPLDCAGDVRWEQLPDGVNLLSSQEDVCYPFVSEIADDVDGDAISSFDAIGWWGYYIAGDGPIPPDAFHVRIRADEDGRPGEILHEITTDEYDEQFHPGAPATYCAALEPGFVTGSGRYHLSIQAVLCFPPQWMWSTGTGNGIPGHMIFPLTGVPDWTPLPELGLPPEVAFVLLERGDTVPVRTTTLGRIKALYHR